MKNYRITKQYQVNLGELEHMKREAWDSFVTAKSDANRIECILKVINSHYIRSSDRVLEAKENNPDFATYASHWLVAQKKGYGAFPVEVIALAAKHYPAPSELAIVEGKSYWEPILAKKYNSVLVIPRNRKN